MTALQNTKEGPQQCVSPPPLLSEDSGDGGRHGRSSVYKCRAVVEGWGLCTDLESNPPLWAESFSSFSLGLPHVRHVILGRSPEMEP